MALARQSHANTEKDKRDGEIADRDASGLSGASGVPPAKITSSGGDWVRPLVLDFGSSLHRWFTTLFFQIPLINIEHDQEYNTLFGNALIAGNVIPSWWLLPEYGRNDFHKKLIAKT